MITEGVPVDVMLQIITNLLYSWDLSQLLNTDGNLKTDKTPKTEGV